MAYLVDDLIVKEQLQIRNLLPETGDLDVIKELKAGLTSQQKYISPKFFYDAEGSKLFEEITRLKEYYPTNTEKSIIKNIYSKLGFDFQNVIELGSGDDSKISLLFNQLPEELVSEITYYPVDISKSAIKKAAGNLIQKFPDLMISGVAADFIHQIPQLSFDGTSLFLFFGSTIGNLSERERKTFIQHISAEMNAGDVLLLGMDLVKKISILERAYNDELGITAKFNKNILKVVNKWLGSNLDPELFKHYAFFNRTENRIEMHLIALKDLMIKFPKLNQEISFKKGESIHTENSQKFTPESIESIGEYGKLKLEHIYTDKNQWFCLAKYVKQ